MKVMKLLVVFAAIVCSTKVLAQSVLNDFSFSLRPQAGVYYDATQSGTGLTVDIIPLSPTSDLFFGTYYHYAPEGSATWMNFQNTVVQAPKADYQTTGVAAFIRGSWLRAQGGQCFDCAYHSITSDFPPLGERTIEIVGSRHLRMPASGNAAVRNMKLVKAVTQGINFSAALLENGAVWSVKQRSLNSQGVVVVSAAGWLKFRKRPATDQTNLFSGYNAAGVIPVPTHLAMEAATINTVQQYEGVCLREGSTTTAGSCSSFLYESTADANANRNTFVVDPATDRIRFFARCVSGSGAPCPQHLPTYIIEIGDVFEAGPDSQGMERLVIRGLHPEFGGYIREYELTRLSPAHLAEVFPSGVP